MSRIPPVHFMGHSYIMDLARIGIALDYDLGCTGEGVDLARVISVDSKEGAKNATESRRGNFVGKGHWNKALLGLANVTKRTLQPG